MPTLSNRIERLEQAAEKARPNTWRVPFIEYDPALDPGGVQANAKADALRAEALASGWRPSDGVYCVLVELARD